MEIKKKIIAGASAVTLIGVIAAGAILTGFTGNNKSAAAVQVRAAALKKGDMSVSVSATGTVYSTQATNVYSNLNYPVKAVLVSAGDTVKEGDVLAELDISGLEIDIEQKKASISSSQATASHNLATAQNDLAAYKRNAENGTDSNLVNAESAVATAELDYENAKLDLESAKLDVQSAELDIQNASNTLYAAKRDLNEARDNDEDDATLDKLRDSVRSCETALEKSETNLEKVKGSLEKSKSNLEKSKANLDKAVTSNEVAKISSSDTLVTYENKVKSAQLNTNFNDQWVSIQKLESDLEKAVITSPVSGTVTSVNAVEGGSGSGLLFIIQDTGSLKVVTNIKEYDVGSVSVGNKVVITTEAADDEEFSGTLSKIAPTSTLTTAGDMTSTSTDAEFESEISVSSSSKSGLRIGMNAQLSIITEEKKDIYSVLYDAVTKAEGETIVYEAKQQEDGSFMAHAVPVSTGMENDLYIEITGDALSDGMFIISDATGITEGMAVEIRGMAGKQGGDAPSGNKPDGAASGNRSGGVVMGGPGMGGVRMGG